MKKLSIELLTTGTELLLGSIVNTNAAWVGEKLFESGLRLSRQVSVPDGDAIREAMEEAALRSDVVLVSGGLGPTSDDVTREALSGMCGVKLVTDGEALRSLEEFFAGRGLEMAESNRKQAMVPEGARVLPNDCGTAPGLWMPANREKGFGEVVLLPGPPRELTRMMERQVLPVLKQWGKQGLEMKTVKMVGIGESDLQQLVDAELAGVDGLETGYCARLGEVDVRLIGESGSVKDGFSVLRSLASEYMVEPLGMSLEEAVVAHLKKKGLKVATAESCTGGLIAKRITDVAGASDVFGFGYVTYANEAKERLLGIPREVIREYGAVSEETARAMALGALKGSGADVSVAVTGIAGPSGGMEDKPVGTVWMAWAFRGGAVETRLAYYPSDRDAFRQRVSQTALARLLKC